MSVLVLQHIPSEVLVHILEIVGKSICQDLITIDFHRVAKSSNAIPYGRHLNQFLQVCLVCKLFHRLLTDYVRVHGSPWERLMDLQILKFTNFLESVKIIQSQGPRGIRMPVLAPNRRGRHRGELWLCLEESPISPHLQPAFPSERSFPVFKRNECMVQAWQRAELDSD
jgi:hypothetical protein